MTHAFTEPVEPQPSVDNQEALETEAESLLGAIDTDCDGAVSVDELRAHMLQRGWTQAMADTVFAALDGNQDEKLSRAELAACTSRRDFVTPSSPRCGSSC